MYGRDGINGSYAEVVGRLSYHIITWAINEKKTILSLVVCVEREKRKTAQQCVGVSVVSGVHCHCHQVLMRKFPDGEYKEGCSVVVTTCPKPFDS